MKSIRIVFLSVLLLFLANLVWGQKSQKPRLPASAIKTSAKISMKDDYKMYDSAATILEEGVEYYPDDAEMHYLLGEAYFYKKNYAGMGEQFTLAESLKSDAKWIEEINKLRNETWKQVFSQAATEYNEKNYDSSLVKFITCTKIDRTNYRAFLYAGLIYSNKQELDQARSYLQAGLKLSPDNPEMLRGYADFLNTTGDQQGALEYYKKALDKDPKNVEVLINLVNIYSNARDYDQAIDYSNKLIEYDSTFKNGYFNIGDIYLHQKYASTVRALDSLKDSSGTYLKDEKSSARIGDLTKLQSTYLAQAQEAFEKVVALDSTDIEAQVYLAQSYGEQNDFDKALTILDAIVVEDTTNCIAWQDIAVYCTKKSMTLKGTEATKIGEKAKVAWQKAQDCLNSANK
jgi:tetratricopeptide (TPR) repeat protein